MRSLAVAELSVFALCCHLRINFFSSNSLGPSAPDEAYSRNVRSSGTLKLGTNVCFRFIWVNDMSDTPTLDTVPNPEPLFDEMISMLKVKLEAHGPQCSPE